MKNNYYENIYLIDSEYSNKLKILELPFYNSVLFFMIGNFTIKVECSQKSKVKLDTKEKMIFMPIKLQKIEKSILNDSVVSSKNYRKNTNPNPRRNLYPLKSQTDYNSSINIINSMDLSQSRIESYKDINISEENSNNISIFPANKNYHRSAKDNISNDNTIISENPRNHSFNPFRKNGNRIQKISNLLGHIFDKKIEQIRNKFSSTL